MDTRIFYPMVRKPTSKRDEMMTEMIASFYEPVRRKEFLPDVTLVVGGVEFKEYSQQLCRWSQYFEVALHGGMKEAETKRFEFPDRDPKEWEWIAAVMAPLSKEKVTVEKLTVALSWFCELCCNDGLEECDNILFAGVLEGLTGRISTYALGRIIECLNTCVVYQLQRSKYKCLELAIAILDSKPSCACENKWKSIISLVKRYGECREALLPTLQGFLPPSMSNGQQELLLQNEIMHHYVLSEIKYRLERTRSEELVKRNEVFVKRLEKEVISPFGLHEQNARYKLALQDYKSGKDSRPVRAPSSISTSLQQVLCSTLSIAAFTTLVVFVAGKQSKT
jgi:BTB/POZ domain